MRVTGLEALLVGVTVMVAAAEVPAVMEEEARFAERLKSGGGLVIARVMSKVCVKFPLIPLSLIAQ